MQKKTVIVSAVLAGAIVLGGVGAGAFAITSTQPRPSVTETSAAAPSVVTPKPAEEAVAETLTVGDTLTYLAEEEKLARDVYLVLGEMWGGQIFTNIGASEVKHQDQVATLLNTYSIADPRSSEVGVFTNPELQALYDQLIAQGSQSVTEAYQVGIIIEETDIADLQESIAMTQDQTILNTLNTLLAASQNHLNAFSRKV